MPPAVRGRRRGRYRSTLEANVASQLSARRVSFEYEDTRYTYLKLHTYNPDFRLPNGILLEVKGFFTPADRKKHLLVREQNPEADIRFVFQDASKRLSPVSKTTYAAWCEQHGFQWWDLKTNPQLPADWLS